MNIVNEVIKIKCYDFYTKAEIINELKSYNIEYNSWFFSKNVFISVWDECILEYIERTNDFKTNKK